MIKNLSHDDYYFEALLKYDVPSEQSIYYFYSTNYQNKLTLLENVSSTINKMNGYNIISNASIPVSPSEIFDMNIYVTNSNEIQKFAVNYRNYKPPPFAPGIPTGLLPNYDHKDLSLITIRSDFGHGKEKPHTNINYFKEISSKKIKINDKSIDYLSQNIKFDNYDQGGLEQMINLVLTEAELVSKHVGIEYWLLTNYISIDKNQIIQLWEDSGVKTPLCILSNNIRNAIFNEFETDISHISNAQLREITITQLQQIKEYEFTNPDSAPIIPLSNNIDAKFPFPMICFPGFQCKKILLNL